MRLITSYPVRQTRHTDEPMSSSAISDSNSSLYDEENESQPLNKYIEFISCD